MNHSEKTAEQRTNAIVIQQQISTGSEQAERLTNDLTRVCDLVEQTNGYNKVHTPIRQTGIGSIGLAHVDDAVQPVFPGSLAELREHCFRKVDRNDLTVTDLLGKRYRDVTAAGAKVEHLLISIDQRQRTLEEVSVSFVPRCTGEVPTANPGSKPGPHSP